MTFYLTLITFILDAALFALSVKKINDFYEAQVDANAAAASASSNDYYSEDYNSPYGQDGCNA